MTSRANILWYSKTKTDWVEAMSFFQSRNSFSLKFFDNILQPTEIEILVNGSLFAPSFQRKPDVNKIVCTERWKRRASSINLFSLIGREFVALLAQAITLQIKQRKTKIKLSPNFFRLSKV